MLTKWEFTSRHQDGWISRRFVMPLRHIKTESPLTIRGRHYEFPEKLTIFFYVNEKLIHEEINPFGEFSITLMIPPTIRGKLEIVSSDVFVPKEKGINEDPRELSFLLDDVVIPGLPDLMEPYTRLFEFKPSREVYFLDDEIWDQIAFLLDDSYKVPDKVMLDSLKQAQWWKNMQPPESSYVRGILYDKFSGAPVRNASVRLFGLNKQLIAETSVHGTGQYEFAGVVSGQYVLAGKSDEYGEQKVPVRIDGSGMKINIPMLPLP
ncbi:carboxypeptidase-like regulatory domain-containing protein [Paenibacillus alkalitolerans]|uniref:carboxypeptidase-like regulatory domain-containing protein n=1 Tax=Paenibacillus alkalitolerans TaxID=2799335 RepID=UPI0018F6E539|nr:carboxypeptidase-like regulatory domain-containing protein [Paenibacillus alkalitolerans]